jgi:hypothetical protein
MTLQRKDMNTRQIYELAGGDITVWTEESGAIMLKVRAPFGDPVELGEEDALELGALLVRLVKDE